MQIQLIIFGLIIAIICVIIIILMESKKGVVIGIINDLHLDPYYNSMVDEVYFCRGKNPFDQGGASNAKFEARYGRYGCDPNDLLVRLMLRKLSSDH